ELEAMAFNLKKTCACGGALKGRVIELQGDVCDRVMGELEKLGYKPVRAGG
ncbi:MAG: translation initiation factor 1, partial [Lentimonas sp.]